MNRLMPVSVYQARRGAPRDTIVSGELRPTPMGIQMDRYGAFYSQRKPLK
ncbi:MAG: hypothetical protein GY742_20380 [Hyphomicrobiales bacterium]|nr:hypothetical protein [Hyphomicrobiales bacterium]